MDIEILTEQNLRYWCNRLQFPNEAVELFVKTAGEIKKDPALLAVFQASYEQIVIRGEWHSEWENYPIDPLVTQRLGESDTLFYLIAYLSALPGAEQEYIRKGIDLAIFDTTMSDIRTWLIHYHDVYGKWLFRQFHWVSLHLSCKLFRLGRMQFVLNTFDGGTFVLQNKASGKIIILADPETALRQDGCAFGAGDLPTETDSWKPSFEESDAGWTGHIVSPYGQVQNETAFFARPEWDLKLKKGDRILDIHIPRKDRFNVDDCRESFQQAAVFFARYFPDQPYRAGFCHTWFFSPQLQQILPAESNIVRFQREFYLYPYAGKLGFLWFYVFGEGVPVGDLAAAPRQTSLQQAVLAWLEKGGEIFDLPGLMFHSPEEWGTQPYMREWDHNFVYR